MPVGDNLRSLPVITTRRGSCEYSRCVCSFLVVVECTWTVLASPRACVFMYINLNTKHGTCWIKEPSDLFRKSAGALSTQSTLVGWLAWHAAPLGVPRLVRLRTPFVGEHACCKGGLLGCIVETHPPLTHPCSSHPSLLSSHGRGKGSAETQRSQLGCVDA